MTQWKIQYNTILIMAMKINSNIIRNTMCNMY